MDFTLDSDLSQVWTDSRLAFEMLETGFKQFEILETGSKESETLYLGSDFMNNIWKPDTFFANEKKSFFHFGKLLYLYRIFKTTVFFQISNDNKGFQPKGLA